MIKKINNQNEEVSRQIRTLFQASYQVEADLLKVTNFPPLNRKLDQFVNSDTEFYGLFRAQEIAAIVEVKTDTKNTDIHSLVVQPDYFRQGLGRELMQFVLNTFNSESFTVETGVDNGPATNLYQQLGFVEQQQWDTEFGIRKVRFKRTRT
ncbi:MAG: GNAT family N-acetyltransferase [Cyclobacteriaceae bacterium]